MVALRSCGCAPHQGFWSRIDGRLLLWRDRHAARLAGFQSGHHARRVGWLPGGRLAEKRFQSCRHRDWPVHRVYCFGLSGFQLYPRDAGPLDSPVFPFLCRHSGRLAALYRTQTGSGNRPGGATTRIRGSPATGASFRGGRGTPAANGGCRCPANRFTRGSGRPRCARSAHSRCPPRPSPGPRN